ncbi:MAG TPA: hypothetical protein PLT68_11775 [Actinomycetota bacterium]|nr:hypothetical protein [Actinomycetota bacterium]
MRPVGVVARYVVLGAAIGIPAGLLWVWWAPRVLVASTDNRVFLETYPQGFATTDLLLGALLLVSGLGIGVAAARRLGQTGFVGGWVHVIGAAAGAGVCAAVARILGWWLAGRVARELPDGTVELPVRAGAGGVLLLGVFSALLVIVLYAAFARDPATTG